MSIIDLKNKVALVTGSAQRVGKSIALALAEQGMHIVVHYQHSEQEAQATAQEIAALGSQPLLVQGDHSNPTDVARFFGEIRQRFGRLDLLVNSASIFDRGNFIDLSLEDWQRSLDTNLTGPFLCSQHAARLMLETGTGGSIIQLLDTSAIWPMKSWPAHSVSKAALATLTAIMAQSLAPTIRVNAISAGPVLRDEGTTPEVWERIGKRLLVGHTGDPMDIAQAIVFLATQPYITGTILRVDGGDYYA